MSAPDSLHELELAVVAVAVKWKASRAHESGSDATPRRDPLRERDLDAAVDALLAVCEQ